MSFYLKPPSGFTQFHRLEKYALTRLGFLLQLLATEGDPISIQDLLTNQATVEDSDCLIEGSRWDKISHFILRLGCSGKEEMVECFVRAEAMLFEVRFLNMTQQELSHLFQTLNPAAKKSRIGHTHHTNVGTSIVGVVDLFAQILHQFGSWDALVRDYLSGSSATYIPMPFQFVLELVKSRAINLDRGTALVPVSKLRQVFKTLFEILLRRGIHLAEEKYEIIVQDNRMKILFAKLRCLYRQNEPSSFGKAAVVGKLYHTEVDGQVKQFPPCMQHLHRTLRRQHRLSHHARIQYSLFLKEAGLTAHEALMFWRQEYSLVSGDKKVCSHNWQQDGKRYTYNIRHLYGLEGSRVNYRGHCCHSIQTRQLHAGEEGGCPFVHFDVKHLEELFCVEGINGQEQQKILKSVSKGDQQSACQMYLQARIRHLVSNEPLSKLVDHLDMETDQTRHTTEGHLFAASVDCLNLDYCTNGFMTETSTNPAGMYRRCTNISECTNCSQIAETSEVPRNCDNIHVQKAYEMFKDSAKLPKPSEMSGTCTTIHDHKSSKMVRTCSEILEPTAKYRTSAKMSNPEEMSRTCSLEQEHFDICRNFVKPTFNDLPTELVTSIADTCEMCRNSSKIPGVSKTSAALPEQVDERSHSHCTNIKSCGMWRDCEKMSESCDVCRTLCRHCADGLKSAIHSSTSVTHENLVASNAQSADLKTNSESDVQVDVNLEWTCFADICPSEVNDGHKSNLKLVKMEGTSHYIPSANAIHKPIDYYSGFKKLMLDLGA